MIVGVLGELGRIGLVVANATSVWARYICVTSRVFKLMSASASQWCC